MVIAIARKQQLRYTPEEQDEDGGVLLLTPLSLEEEQSLLDKTTEEGRKYHRDINAIFRTHVTGWEGVVDEDGAEVPHPGGELPDEWVKSFPLGDRIGVFNYLLGQAGLSAKGEDDLGKSG